VEAVKQGFGIATFYLTDKHILDIFFRLILRFCRLYLKYIRTLAEKTEIGRLAAPSLLRLVDEAMKINSSKSYFNGRMSSETWDTLDQILEVKSNII